ncbi:hypothetical protein IVA94_39255 [Bradyrhizobium sp. 156]|uniref:hypothetical protein n=1 Tax=Bradyrhizobium sp. 156 TaxID=2782630 RepID=UPI001FF98AC0|nr:hypothetical protein [Bradyrhizobium sp. 156]MCK1326688.1 hypothetical protein [Bradyrhizobium sp. 156]
MPRKKLSSEGEVTAAYGAAMVAAFQVLINCLEESDALLPGQFSDALGVYMEMMTSLLRGPLTAAAFGSVQSGPLFFLNSDGLRFELRSEEKCEAPKVRCAEKVSYSIRFSPYFHS